MVCSMERQVTSFAMPGTGIPGFAEHAKRIANAGIYDLTVHHEQILVPIVLRTWNLESIEGLSSEGEQARDRLMAYLVKSERVAKRLAERRERTMQPA
jgi:acyl-[acyl-carrier-protein] desaturase